MVQRASLRIGFCFLCARVSHPCPLISFWTSLVVGLEGRSTAQCAPFFCLFYEHRCCLRLLRLCAIFGSWLDLLDGVCFVSAPVFDCHPFMKLRSLPLLFWARALPHFCHLSFRTWLCVLLLHEGGPSQDLHFCSLSNLRQ